VAVLRLFAAAREAAGTGTTTIEGATVGEVLEAACAAFGPGFAAVLGTCRVWVNGEPAGNDHPVSERDEVAVLPPVSGGV
jgi:molybdopterin converting factor small subunit